MSAPAIRQIPLTIDEWERVSRPIRGSGGHQVLLRNIARHINRDTRVWTALPQHVARAAHYAADYGSGGYQDRFKALLEAVERASR